METIKVATCTLELPCGEPGQIITIKAEVPAWLERPEPADSDGRREWLLHAVTINIPIADAKWSPRHYVIEPGDFEVFMYSRRSLAEPYRWVALRDRKKEMERRDEW